MKTQANQTCSNCKHFGTLPRSAADSRHQCRHPARWREHDKTWKMPTDSCIVWEELPVPASPPLGPLGATGLPGPTGPADAEEAAVWDSIGKQLQAAQQEAGKLACLLDKVRTHLKGLTTAIHREDGKVWLAGHGTHVLLIEDSLQMLEEYIEGRESGK